MTATAAAPRGAPSSRAALPVLYLGLSTLAFLLVGGRHAGMGGSLWFPPAGVAFGYLLVAGWRSAWLVLVARLAGGLVMFPDRYAHDPLAACVTDVASTLALVLAAELLRRVARPDSPYALLTRFLGLGVVLAPIGAASAAGLLGAAHGQPLDAAAWARAVVGTATAVLTLTPAFLVIAAPWTAAAAPTRSVPARRRWELAGQALLIVLIPATSLLTGGTDVRQLTLLPVALVPLAWTAADPDRRRGAAVLAVAGLALGAAAELRFGDSETTFRLQLVMFAGALASLFAVAGLVADALARDGAEVETTRWRALVEASPVAVARIGRDGRWRPEGAPGADPDAARAAGDVLARAARVPGVAAAVAAGAPATVDWGVDDDTGRRFVTRVTPLPDGDTLAVTTETTRLHSARWRSPGSAATTATPTCPTATCCWPPPSRRSPRDAPPVSCSSTPTTPSGGPCCSTSTPCACCSSPRNGCAASSTRAPSRRGRRWWRGSATGSSASWCPRRSGRPASAPSAWCGRFAPRCRGRPRRCPSWRGPVRAALDPEREARASLQRAEAALQAAAELQANAGGRAGSSSSTSCRCAPPPSGPG